MKSFKFPNAAIPHDNINFDGLILPGNNITGGIHKEFNSTCITDIGDETELTIMNGMVVVENEFITRNIRVKGNATFEGDVIIKGRIPIDDDIINTSKKMQGDLENGLRDKLDAQVNKLIN